MASVIRSRDEFRTRRRFVARAPDSRHDLAISPADFRAVDAVFEDGALSSDDRSFEAPDLIEVMDQAVRYNRYLLDQIESWASDKRRLLDFGAGNGRFAIALRKAGFEIHAVESDPVLREKIAAGDVTAHAGLAALPDQEFDGIYTLNVLEHIVEDEVVLSQFCARIRPGGGLLVYVPAFQLLFSANDVRVGHVRRYRQAELVAKIEAAGFTIDSARYVDCIGFAAALAYRLMGDRDGGLSIAAVRFYDGFLFPVSRVLDRVFDRFFGKNLLVLARKPDGKKIEA